MPDRTSNTATRKRLCLRSGEAVVSRLQQPCTMIRTCLILLLTWSLVQPATAQWVLPSSGCSIRYDHDAAGNRISRYWYCWTNDPDPGTESLSDSADAPGTGWKMAAAKDSTLAPLGVKAYPNPSRDRFFLVLSAPIDQAMVEVYDAKGRQLHRSTMAGDRHELDVSILPMLQPP